MQKLTEWQTPEKSQKSQFGCDGNIPDRLHKVSKRLVPTISNECLSRKTSWVQTQCVGHSTFIAAWNEDLIMNVPHSPIPLPDVVWTVLDPWIVVDNQILFSLSKETNLFKPLFVKPSQLVRTLASRFRASYSRIETPHNPAPSTQMWMNSLPI